MKKQPSYLALYSRIRDQITSGIYTAGSRLPSKRTMADNENVSVITVEHALALLEEEGYIETTARSGELQIPDRRRKRLPTSPAFLPARDIPPRSRRVSPSRFPLSRVRCEKS